MCVYSSLFKCSCTGEFTGRKVRWVVVHAMLLVVGTLLLSYANTLERPTVSFNVWVVLTPCDGLSSSSQSSSAHFVVLRMGSVSCGRAIRGCPSSQTKTTPLRKWAVGFRIIAVYFLKMVGDPGGCPPGFTQESNVED